MASFAGHPWGEPDDSGPDPRLGDTGGPVLAGGPVLFMHAYPVHALHQVDEALK